MVANSEFICDSHSWGQPTACAGEPFYKEHDGSRYCVLHFPGNNKEGHFEAALQRKLHNNDFNFYRVWFITGQWFDEFHFSESADFSFATFSGKASFRGATFSAGARFGCTIFHADANFVNAIFDADVNFHLSEFRSSVYFEGARFNGEANFRDTQFKKLAGFRHVTFRDRVRFEGTERHVFTHDSLLDLKFARIEKPEHICFYMVNLRPFWFADVDPRKFEFTNVDWDWHSAKKELKHLERGYYFVPHGQLAIACRHLASNAEENHRYEEASGFRYMAMEARRLEHWSGFDLRKLSWWYWLASGYGERVLRASVVLLSILLVSAALYTQVGFVRWEPKLANENDLATAKRDDTGAPLKLSRALTYSAAVMTFQRPEPRPVTTAAQTIVLLETILGPVQAALLALAIRRKFMR